jgi:hypothetical protein
MFLCKVISGLSVRTLINITYLLMCFPYTECNWGTFPKSISVTVGAYRVRVDNGFALPTCIYC